MVDFGGWDMPVNYGSQIEEHHAVRRAAGVFDVSHMCVIDVRGARTARVPALRCWPTMWPAPSATRQGALQLHAQEDGGILDDLIVYFLDPHWYRVVVNAGTRDSDLAWIRAQAGPFDIEVRERRGPGDARGAGSGGARAPGSAADPT